MSSATTAKRPAKKGAKKAAIPSGLGHIEIPAHCKPSAVCSNNRTRPILTHAYVRNRDDGLWLLASDGYIAAALKVDGEANDGFVPIGALKLMERGQQAQQISETAWRVETNDGEVTFDCKTSVGGSVDYPDLEALGLWDPEKGGYSEDAIKQFASGSPISVGLNTQFMRRVGDALGAGNHGCRFEITAPLRPIRIFSLYDPATRIAMQMPIRLNG